MMKKTTKSPSDADQQPRYKRVTDSKNPMGRTELGFKSPKITDNKSLEMKSPRHPQTSGEIKGREEVERSNPVHNKTTAVRHEYGHEQKTGQITRSRSKQKKDRLTLNIAKLSRKNKVTGKQQKMPESIYMERQQVQEERLNSGQSEQIYQQGWESNESKYQYLAPEPKSDNRRSMFSEEIQSVISQETVQKVRSKEPLPIQIQQPTTNYRKQQNSNTSSAKNITPRSQEGGSRMMEASRITNSRGPSQVFRGQQEMIQEVFAKMNRQKEELHQLIDKLQGEKSRLQETNKELIEAQFNMRNEIELLKMKNMELAKNQENAKYLASQQGLQYQRFRQGFENAFKQTEAQLIKANQQLHTKIGQINGLNLKLRQAQNQCYTLENEVRLLQTQNDMMGKEMEKIEKVHETQMQELRNRYEFMLKERQMREQGPQAEIARQRSIITQLQSQIVTLKKDISAKDNQIIQIGHSIRVGQQERIANQIKARQVEIDNLLEQLNYTHQQVGRINNELSEKTKIYELELRQREKQIADLRRTIQKTTQQVNCDLIDKKAFEEMYGLNSQTQNSSKAFLEMRHKQTEEMNTLRSEVATSNQAFFTIQNENQQLKDRIRRMQQDNQMTNRALNTNLNNLKQAKQTSEKIFKAQIESLNRKIGSVEMRLGLKDKEIREKNKFIQQHLLNIVNGRSDAGELIAKLQAITAEKVDSF